MSANERSGSACGTIVRHNADGSLAAIADEVTIEEPLEMRVGKTSLAVTMRTPGNDEELAAGFLLSEGIVRRRGDLREIAACTLPNSSGNILNIALADSASFRPEAAQRFGNISTSCGLCGKTSIDFIRQQLPPLSERMRPIVASRILLRFPEQLRRAQPDFERTGGIHAAGIFSAGGELLWVREDVGRHNAVDKVIGRAFLDDLVPLRDHVLVVSGRTSLEIVQKALAAGIAVVASVSAPSTLAVNFAREVGQTLIGFLRPPTFNVYAHVERVMFDDYRARDTPSF